MTIYRQGDVLLIATSKVPAGAVKVPRDRRVKGSAIGCIVLAYGEVTGHAHAIAHSQAVLLSMPQVAKDGNPDAVDRWLRLPRPAKLRHEEHETIELPAGDYIVRRQREYHPEELRVVAD